MKKNVKKGLAMALSLLAVLSTTACGGSTDPGSSGNSGSGSGEDSYVIRFAQTPVRLMFKVKVLVRPARA